jgi:mono/diheme cytochrome c family protein
MIDTRILVGLIAILIALGTVAFIGINERDRQAEFTSAFKGRSIEDGAAIYAEYCSPCHGLHGEGIPGVAPTLNSKYFFEQRLDEIGYVGSLQSYVKLTVAGGRPIVTNGQWPRNMPTWSTQFGGPLRNDQVDNVVDYVLNWEVGAPDLGDPNATPTPVPGNTPEERGKNLFAGMGCVGCHVINGQGGAVGPDLTNVYDKGEDYIRQSILEPNAVVAEGYQPGIMPQTFGDRLTDQDMNDLIAYLKAADAGTAP